MRKTVSLILSLVLIMSANFCIAHESEEPDESLEHTVLSNAAAVAGSREDPLVSRRYIQEQFVSFFIGTARSALDAGLSTLYERLELIVGSDSGKTLSGRLTPPLGGALYLRSGSALALLEGSADVGICFGNMLDLTQGEEFSRAKLQGDTALQIGHLYIAAENTLLRVENTGDTVVQVDGSATRVSGSALQSFSDVPADNWAYTSVETMAALGIVSGRGGGIFDPASPMTRGDFVTVLGRLYGVDTARYAIGNFNDVPTGQYYTAYVNWAASEGLVTGFEDGRFAPGENVTRAQLAVLIVRFANFVSVPLGVAANGELFSDDAQIPSWAREQVYTARAAGLVGGKEHGAYDPHGIARRNEVCAILTRLLAEQN